jgi:hypothetical protein
METPHTETVVEKAVAYVKDVFGIHSPDPTPDVQAKPEYHDTAPEITAENAMRLEPNAFGTSVEDLNADSYVRPVGELDVDRLRREVGEPARETHTLNLDPESRRVEDHE